MRSLRSPKFFALLDEAQEHGIELTTADGGLVILFATAGILGLAEIRRMGIPTIYPERFSDSTNKRITAAFAIIVALGGVYYAQQFSIS